MKNKGFTLVELIGVLIVLSVLFMVSLPPIIKMLKGTEAKITYSQKKLVEDSARDMALKSKEMTENNFTYCPTIADIVKKGYLSKEAVKDINKNHFVKVKIKDKKITTLYTETCVEEKLKVEFSLKGQKEITINSGSTYTDAGFTALDENKVDISSKVTKKIIDSNLTIFDTLNTNIVGTYIIEYKLNFNEQIYVVERTVNVKTSDNPLIIHPGDTTIEGNLKIFDVLQGVTATDKNGNNLKVIAQSNLSLGIVGTYIVTYKAIDKSNRITTLTRTIIIKVPSLAKVYGLRWDGNEGYTRLDDAVGMVANVGINQETPKNDFDNAEIYKEMVDVTDTYGNKFVSIPKFYIKKIVTGDVWEWRISKDKKDKDYYLPSCFYDEVKSEEIPYILVGKYDASETGGKLESKTGVKALSNQTINTFRNYAKANNVGDKTGYQLLDIHALDAIQVLFYIEFATLNSQTKMQGYANGNTESIINGTTDVVTASSGSINDLRNGKNAMKYRGIENIYGNMWQFIDGVNLDNAYFYVNRDAKTYASEVINGKYKKVGYNKLNTEGWVTKMGYDPNNPFLQMPQELNGNASTKYGDYYWTNINMSKPIILFGGNWTAGSRYGIGAFNLLYSSTHSLKTICSRLLKTAF